MSGSGASISVVGSNVGPALMQILTADDILPGSDVSYQLCKLIYLYHPIGAKMVEAPIQLAQSQDREITVSGAPERVAEAFQKQWRAMKADKVIANVIKQSRIYGLSSVVLGIEGKPATAPLEVGTLATDSIFLNVLDPLNTAGSLMLDQDPNSPLFQKAMQVTTQGETYHPSRTCVVMNEEPLYISYTGSAFGFTGRSVFQRVLYPLKSYLHCMITDDMIARKAGLLIAKMQAPGGIANRGMINIFARKRSMLQEGRTDNVLSIGVDEDISSLNLTNIDGAGTFARNNILKNLATGAALPAILLENETMVEGFGEGTEDAKVIARFVDGFRESMDPVYEWLTNIVQHRAWNEEFYRGIQQEYPQEYGNVRYASALQTWQNNFTAEWPSLIQEPDSEKVKVEDTKMKAALALYQLLNDGSLDPENKARLTEWLQSEVNKAELIFQGTLSLDTEALAAHAQDMQDAQQKSLLMDQGGQGANGMAAGLKPPSFKLASSR